MNARFLKATGFLTFLLIGASLYTYANAGKSVEDKHVAEVLAVSSDVAYGEYLAGECASCHAKTAVSGSNVPVIHGASAEHIAQALLEYKAGVRENSTMKNVVDALGDEEIAVLSHYLSQATN